MTSDATDGAFVDPAPTAGSDRPKIEPSGKFRINPWLVASWVILAIVLLRVPFMFESFRVDQITAWMPLAIGACGLNLLTGYNGQISVGHGALYGIGAYTAGLMINHFQVPLGVAVLSGAVSCFVVGILIGLPALRIKGLYLALVTLAVATLFPSLLKQFSSLTGGGSGLQIQTLQPYRGTMKLQNVIIESPVEWLDNHQWQYFLFLVVTIVCFLLTRNLVTSRVGRSLVAVRDNETAATVSGIPTAKVKIITFGVSSALAGLAGGLFAIDKAQLYPGSFTIVISIYFLVAVVIGGASSVIGPAIGALFYGIFSDVLIPELPDRLQPSSAVILGVTLILLMLVAPMGAVGVYRSTKARFLSSRARRAAAAKPEIGPAVSGNGNT
ncbi:MAG TPA: branched-chain amino acid ABC transporter permease [Microthrixaceae bacterium]|nr:branched-chain amino acid ABC transporter permease [Microthrixaceae bacterium]